jgi:hypothetical protein
LQHRLIFRCRIKQLAMLHFPCHLFAISRRQASATAGEVQVSEYREEFVRALRGGKKMRDCVFSVLEQRHATDFANGPKGVQYYTNMFEVVRAADVPEAVEEFQKKFQPLLDPDGSRARAAALAADASPRISRHGRWLAAALGAVALLAGTIIGLNALPDPPKRKPLPAPSTIAAAPAPTANVAGASVAPETIVPDSDKTTAEE